MNQLEYFFVMHKTISSFVVLLIYYVHTELNAIDTRTTIASPNSTNATRIGPMEGREQQQKVGAIFGRVKLQKYCFLQKLSAHCRFSGKERQSISKPSRVTLLFCNGVKYPSRFNFVGD